MVATRYLNTIRLLVDAIEARELETIHALGEMIAERVAEGGAVHLYDNGHMLNHELFNRAGGLALLGALAITPPSVTHRVRRREGSTAPVSEVESTDAFAVEWAREVIRQSSCAAGDVLIIGSVSGRSPFIVEMALYARSRGITVVGLTAVSYAKELPASHSSGRLLYQACDVVLDIHSGPGDAALAIEGVSERVGPTSGVTAAVVCWCLVAEVTQALVTRGLEPTVFRSINYPDGPAAYAAQVARYERLGY